MGERRGTKALELWCRRITDGYPDVNVQNMTTSWKDGLAFCAMIHHFRPDLIDFNSLKKDDVYKNNELAFRTAEQHLGIPALLDAEDMATCTVPDRLSILTYLSQFYQTFGGSSPNRLATNRTTEASNERIAPVPEPSKQKVVSPLGMRRDPCVVCGLPVFLAEKLLIARAPYHRTCFRCARCNNQLTPGNYYETEEGQYCCETCPDEEESANICHKYTESTVIFNAEQEKNKPPRPLSDEEKTEKKGIQNLLENTAVPDLISYTSQMRKNFMTSQLLSEKIDKSIAKDMSPNTQNIEVDYNYSKGTKSKVDSAFPDDDENEEENKKKSHSFKMDSPNVEESNMEQYDVYNALNNLGIKNDENQQSIAISLHDMNKKRKEEDTKESPGCADETASSKTKLSLVKEKIQIFETRDKRDHVDGIDQRISTAQDITETESDLWDLAHLRVNEEEREKVALRIKNTYKHKDNDEDIGKRNEKELNITSIESCKKSFSKDVLRMNNERYFVKGQFEESSKDQNNEKRKEDFVKVESERETNNEMDEESYENVESNVLIAEGIDLSSNEDYPEDLNPFKNDNEDSVVNDKLWTAIDNSESSKVSTNPFDSEDENIEEFELPKSVIKNKVENRGIIAGSVAKRILIAPRINLNPFFNEEKEDYKSDKDRMSQENVPIPKPRTINTIPEVNVSRRVNLNHEDMYASNSSLTSSESITTLSRMYRKKKLAPQPPAMKELFPFDQYGSPVLNSTLSSYYDSSSRIMSRARKTKPAPPPPVPTSTLHDVSIDRDLSFDESSIIQLSGDDHNPNIWEDQKTNKDETNRNRQSLNSISHTDCSYMPYADKSVQGKWKRKKGPAPPRPIPHRRKIKVISMKDVKLELDKIELQQQGLEKQGVRLEQLIRDKCESGPITENSSHSTNIEELILELFTLVNEKNELFRKQAELMLLQRQQRLEEEHAEVEYQIRCLMCQPEASKTDFDKQREEALIRRLVEIVERRNEIVECLEMDRRREIEEDKSISKHMNLFVGKTKKKKTKEKKKKTTKDADKDVDETEMKLQRHNKRKWF